MSKLFFYTMVLFFVQINFALSQIYVNANGDVGIGNTNPGWKLQIDGRTAILGNGNTLRLISDNPGVEIGSSTDRIDFWFTNLGYNKLYAQDFYKESDSTLKENIVPIQNGLSTILSLKTYSYNKKSDKGLEKKQFGFLSQEIEKVLPEITNMSKDVLMLDYDQIIPFLVEAVKEQDSIINSQKLQIEELEKIVGQSSTQNNSNKTKATLNQVFPTSANQLISIGYYLPASVSNASIALYNATGVQIKTMAIDTKEAGKLSIKASELIAGMYIYTLSVDGKEVDLKYMVLTK